MAINQKKYYLIEDEYNYLLDEFNKLDKRWRELWEDKKKSVEQTSETWHDNPAFDEVEMQQRILSKKIQDLNFIINNSQILTFQILRSREIDKVVIWKKVLLY